jgi:hypothetical protein
MGAWGVAIFSDDLAADLRDEFRDLIGDGNTPAQATTKLTKEHADSLDDSDEGTVFWLALAANQWNLGRLQPAVKKRALKIIKTGADLERWDIPSERKKREKVLEQLHAQLLKPPPSAKRIPKTHKSANEWQIGEIVAFCLLSNRWTLMRVIGHHEDKGGKFAVCQLLDWIGAEIPSKNIIDELAVRYRHGTTEITAYTTTCFHGRRTQKEKRKGTALSNWDY